MRAVIALILSEIRKAGHEDVDASSHDVRLIVDELGGNNASLGDVKLVANEYAAFASALRESGLGLPAMNICRAKALVLSLQPSTQVCAKCGYPAIRLVDGTVVSRASGAVCEEPGCGESRTVPLQAPRYNLKPSRDWSEYANNLPYAPVALLKAIAPSTESIRQALESIADCAELIRTEISPDIGLNAFALDFGQRAYYRGLLDTAFFQALMNAFPASVGDVIAVAKLNKIVLALPQQADKQDG
jgi:hypothetical protein